MGGTATRRAGLKLAFDDAREGVANLTEGNLTGDKMEDISSVNLLGLEGEAERVRACFRPGNILETGNILEASEAERPGEVNK